MASSTTGRRHTRAGALTVAELVRRQPPSTQKATAGLPGSAQPVLNFPLSGQWQPDRRRLDRRRPGYPTDERPTALLPVVEPPAGRGDEAGVDQAQPSKTVLAGKIIGIGIGLLVLCGAVGIASTIGARHQGEAPVAGAPALLPISGIQALRPDALAAQLASENARTHHSAGGQAGQSSSGSGDAPRPDQSAPADRGQGSGDDGSAAAPGGDQHGNGAAQSPTDLVRQFFGTVREQPHLAAGLLDPRLLGTQLADFVRSWTSTAALEVEQVNQTSTGAVEAVVRMLQSDGTWIRADELFTLTSGPRPLISHVQLLSAQNG